MDSAASSNMDSAASSSHNAVKSANAQSPVTPTPTAFEQLLVTRRSHRATTATSILSDDRLEKLVQTALNQAPSAFDSQSSCAVLLLKEEHVKLWETAKANVTKTQKGEHLEGSLTKFSGYQSGYGTVLIYEDSTSIESLQSKLPPLKDLLSEWQNHGSGILQFVVWSLLAEAGLGASLQHQQKFVEEHVAVTYGVPETWKLVAQIPFGGIPEGSALPKKVPVPIETRFRSFGKH
ncbi:hypothetical protein HDU98_003304 [Podochytrium sp. JEL0797]|nr:hypothetical protein HDU98_003304 [Podochytrium sp. JEL0797]